ncbi:hypothetical protein M413DRAFT_289150 [Hebeloma cylindrosporum]|uniref:F-box domain-containing protein n=1 Tax=Hebeloma cylindrosporum TaxID=76867 RepID=A0A0C3BWW5_HEBCY|nr:hypothetical protein M413DRAFT_289150 [Hebeloma cylindrosporum h7]
MADLSRLPLDLYRPIVSYLPGNHDLLTLCATSREWWFESHRALFRHVKLRGGNRLKSWTKTILNSPRITPLTHAITLPTRATLTQSEKVALAEALSKLVNLQELYISHTMTLCSLDAYIDPWMLECCTKELRVFHNELEEFEAGFEAYSLFFGDHPQISHLYWAREEDTTPIDMEVLRNLTIVHLKNWRVLNILSPRRISRIRIGTVHAGLEISAFATSLSQFKDSLTHLSVTIRDLTGMRLDYAMFSITTGLRLLGNSLPKLRFLYLSGGHILKYALWRAQANQLVEALSTFRGLDTVSLDISEPRMQSHTWLCDMDMLEDPASCRKFVERFMESCPRLHRLAIGPLGIHCQKKWGGSGSPCYVRRPGGRVEFEGFDIINSDSWAGM